MPASSGIRPRLLVALALVPVLAATLTGCGGGDDPELPPRTPIPSELAEPLWNPCDALDPAEVSTLFTATFDQQTGTSAEPRCTFTPTEEGETVLDINYQLYGGTLQDIVDQLGDPGDTSELTAPRIPGSSGARLIIDTDEDALAVTGLVRNGRLVQVVNALDLAPYDRDATVAGVRRLLTELASHAEESGLNTGTPPG
ncbi:hypothetical protein [Nocardioides sp.]|uniref:hypothetical protein n=1 Tax=Nocardioides sp. TaxID=35761 RepID=UPI00321B3A8F